MALAQQDSTKKKIAQAKLLKGKGFSVAEIAEKMDVSNNGVRYYLRGGKKYGSTATTKKTTAITKTPEQPAISAPVPFKDNTLVLITALLASPALTEEQKLSAVKTLFGVKK